MRGLQPLVNDDNSPQVSVLHKSFPWQVSLASTCFDYKILAILTDLQYLRKIRNFLCRFLFVNVGPSSTKHSLFCLQDPVRTAQKTLPTSILKISQLMLYREIIAVCSEIHTKHINALCGQNVELLNVEPGGTYSDHWDLDGYMLRIIYKDSVRTAQ